MLLGGPGRAPAQACGSAGARGSRAGGSRGAAFPGRPHAPAMAERGCPLEAAPLPAEVRESLAELELELSEGERPQPRASCQGPGPPPTGSGAWGGRDGVTAS